MIGRRSRRVLLLALPLLLVLALSGCGPQAPERHVVLATTTSISNSGLLDELLAAFERQHGVQVRSHLVGSGLALRMLEKAEADAVISHAPAAETSALRSHPTWRYQKIMFNDFVLAGPADDPADVRRARDVREAMQRIAISGVRFLSRGDESGTHEREEALWQAVGARPASGRLIVAGAGMGATLRVASETASYTLTDRASYAQLASALRLSILHERDPELVNTYAVIIDTTGPRAGDAGLFFDWLSGDAGRRFIDTYRVRGSQVFFSWPQQRSADRPDARPRP